MTVDLKTQLAAKAADAEAPATSDGAQPQTVSGFIKSLTGEISRALPAHMSAERVARIALTEVRRTPELGQATPQSFAGALLTCASLGLEPGGGSGEAYLLPYYNRRAGVHEVQMVIGYQGMVKLFWQHPLAAGLDAHEVREADMFEHEYGLNPVLRHRPARPSANRPRGNVIAYYAVARLSNGGSSFVVMYPEDIEAIRRRVNSKDKGPWASDYDQMALKTCVRRLFKLLPKSTELSAALAYDGTVRTDLSTPMGEAAAPAPELAPVPDPQDDAGPGVDVPEGEEQ